MKRSTIGALAFLFARSALALPPSDFREDDFFRITTVVGGEELSLTFVRPGEECRADAQTSCPSKSRVELQKFKNELTQLWQVHLARVSPGHIYALYSKYSDHDSGLTGVMLLTNPDNRFLKDRAYKETHNRVSVGGRSGESSELWSITKLDNGQFRIMSMKGIDIKKPKEESYPSTWNESRSLEAIKTADGKIELRQGVTAEVASQYWKLTAVED